MNPVRNRARASPVRGQPQAVAEHEVHASNEDSAPKGPTGRAISNGMKTFREKVRDIVRNIPKGKTMTYKQVAAKAGNSKASRAVGAIMRTNYDPTIPCHRVVRSDGSLGSYNRGGERKKRALLKAEGAMIRHHLNGQQAV